MSRTTDSFLMNYHRDQLYHIKNRLVSSSDEKGLNFFRYLVPFLQYNIPYHIMLEVTSDDAVIYEKQAREYDPVEATFSQPFDFYDKYGDYPKYFERALEENWSMLFFGANESGKTFTAVYFLAQIIEQGYSAYYIPFQEFLFVYNRANFNQEEKAQELLNHIYSCDCLVVDELGKESSTTDNVKGALEELIKEREAFSYPTIFCGNVRFRSKRDEHKTFKQKYKYSVFNALVTHYRFYQFAKTNRMRQKTRDANWTFD